MVNVTAQFPVTAQPPVANVTVPPIAEATTNLINEDNVTEAPDNRPPPHPGTVRSPQLHLDQLIFSISCFCDFQNYCQ